MQKLLEKASEQITMGDPEKAESYIQDAIAKLPAQVRVEVRHGIATVRKCPDWVEVEVVDYDILHR